MNDLVTQVEGQLRPLQEEFAEVLPATIPPERLVRTVLVSCQRNPKLMAQNLRPTLLQSAMTSAVLGLEVDGVTGQGFLIPFGGKNPAVQFIPGYKGYNTIAGRAGFTINGGVVREGDEFDYQEGSAGFIHHKRLLSGESQRKIIAAWATATKPGASPIVSLLSIDELMAIKGKSAGAKKYDSPWNDQAVGFPAMCEKSAKRRLARSMPLNTYQLSAAMESQQDIGNTCHINKAAELVIDEGVTLIPESEQRATQELVSPDMFKVVWIDGRIREMPSVDRWQSAIQAGINYLGSDKEAIKKFKADNQPVLDWFQNENPDVWDWANDKFNCAMGG